MSYILQALAQSERERHQEENPDLSRVFDAETTLQAPRKRRLIIVIALIANAMLIAGIFMLANNTDNAELASSSAVTIVEPSPSRTPAISTTPAPTPVPVQIPVQAPAKKQTPAAAPVTAPAPVLTPEIAAPPVSTNPELIEIPDTTPSYRQPEMPVALPQTQTVSAPEQNSSNQRSGQTSAQTPVQTSNQTQEANPVETEIPILEPVAAEETSTVAQLTDNEPTSWTTGVDEQVHALQGIDMTIHVYSAQPGDRFVFINGKQYREGDTLAANGAELAAITPDGIIVDFGNRRTLLNRVR